MLYPQEQTLKLFEQLPRELRAAIFSEDTADYISQIAERYKITDKTKDLAILVGNMLLGLLSPEDLPKELEQELKIPEEKINIISQEVNRLILYPVKDKLADFYKEIIFAPSGIITHLAEQKITVNVPRIEPQEKILSNESPAYPDAYREVIQ